ncbi:unnamed protein product [Heterosigma akashiwo]|mmetsp:Transcript_11476/g.16045  ORF Transcript_11476/g.16045 Transcript_11476/m.16045 type:complete len:379 (-) Transcript_11476:654-1790(-)
MGGPNDQLDAHRSISLEQITINHTNQSYANMKSSNGTQNGASSGADKKENSKAADQVVKKEVDVKSSDMESKSTWMSYLAFGLLALISYYTVPDSFRPTTPTIQHVFYYGWVTALSTGLGAVPMFFASEIGEQMLGISNAIASGMMLAASCSLIYEGATNEAGENQALSEGVRAALGAASGLLFIYLTKQILDKYEDLKLGGLQGVDARKVLLIVFVMTLHSFSEGVGIGVSFGGSAGARLGVFISASLAVHNVPEGLAVALVLNPRKVSKLNTALWCIFTSMPQPLMAVPAFLFVEQFLPLLPVGLGFAAGAMFWVAVFELFAEACEDSSKLQAGLITACSFAGMLYVQHLLDVEEGVEAAPEAVEEAVRRFFWQRR